MSLLIRRSFDILDFIAINWSQYTHQSPCKPEKPIVEFIVFTPNKVKTIIWSTSYFMINDVFFVSFKF
jgi:hypothetical protein